MVLMDTAVMVGLQRLPAGMAGLPMTIHPAHFAISFNKANLNVIFAPSMKPYPLILLLLLTVVARGQLKVIITATTNSDCGMNNGTVSAVGSGGVPPYEYALAGVSPFSTGNFTSVRPGQYLVSVRDAAGTIASQRVDIINTSTPPVPSFTIINPSSCDKLDGSLTVVMPGGFPPFQYSFDDVNYQSSNVFANLTHGTYRVFVKDANGCRDILPTSVSLFAQNCGYTIRITANFPLCGNNGKMSVVDPLPGIAPRKYSIDGITYQDSATFTNLAPGLQSIRIKDATGVVRIFSTTLYYNCVMQLSLATVAPGCNTTGGSITATPTKGEGPYEYSINDGPYQTSNSFDFLKAGTYLVKVRDVKGLTVSMSATLVNSCITATIITKDATCSQANGEIEVTGAGGTAPYLYSIDGINYQVSNRFVGLKTGKYTTSVKDAAGGTDTISAVISGQPNPKVSGIATDASCEDNDGSITAVNARGQLPLAYSINSTDFNASPVFNNLASGNYKLMLKDGNGCTDSVAVIIPLKNSIFLSLDSQVTICEGSIASLRVKSNASLFQWNTGPGITDQGRQDQNVAPLVTTQYTVTATTGKCTLSDTVMVVVKAAPHANAGKDQAMCYGEDARLEGSGGLIFNWTPARYLTDSHSSNPISVKPAATLEYSLTVTDAAGCISLQPDIVKITVTTPQVFAGNDTSVLTNQPFNLNAVDVNNTGFIQYNWQPSTGLNNPNVSNPVATVDKHTIYRVIAKTASGCEASDDVNIQIYTSADIYVPNAFTPNGDGHNDYAIPLLRGIKELTNFTIYNRWGNIVYRFTPGSNGWDGRLNGVLQNSGLFTWIAACIDFNNTTIKRSGTITLIR